MLDLSPYSVQDVSEGSRLSELVVSSGMRVWALLKRCVGYKPLSSFLDMQKYQQVLKLVLFQPNNRMEEVHSMCKETNQVHLEKDGAKTKRVELCLLNTFFFSF